MSYEHLKLKVLPGIYKYVLLQNNAELVSLAGVAPNLPMAIFSASDEISAIISEEIVVEAIKIEPNWVCIRVVGEMPFGTVQGLIATIGSTLKTQKLGMCVISTFLTDWFFVKRDVLQQVQMSLEKAGWVFEK